MIILNISISLAKDEGLFKGNKGLCAEKCA